MVQIIADSTCDLPAERAREAGVQIVPLTVSFGKEHFLDGIDLTASQFYARLAQSPTLPTTSQINPACFQAVFQEVLDRGDDVAGIFLSSELSGTYQSACIARGMVSAPERVFLVDSRTVTFPMALLVEEAVRLRDAGASAAEIAAQAAGLTGRIRLLAVLDTLKYLQMGGRISSATAVVGGLLGITPLVGIIDGKVVSIGKCRGRRAAFKWMKEQIAREPIDFSRCIGFGHSNCPEAMEQIMTSFSAEVSAAFRVVTGEIGPVVGTYTGPGGTGITYFAKI